jgi:hypothetical protein
MGDELKLLTDAMAELLGQSGAAPFRDLAQKIRQAAEANDFEEWQEKIGAYHTLVTSQIKDAIPAPLRTVPGMEAMVRRLANGALDEAEQALSLGLAEAGISMPAVYLPRPQGFPPGPPALLGRLPPTGIHLNFGSGPASGGGRLDYQQRPNQRLSGRFGLKLTLAQVNALIILEESQGTLSLFSLLSARFAPGLQLGFGFALSGIGGVIGINRGVDPGALQQQFRSGRLTHALFGDDPIRNATSVIATLGSVFQLRQGAQVFGPSLQISWLKLGVGDLFTADLAVLMQLPGPSRIDILGSVRSAIPPVFRLQLDVHGEIDLASQIIGFHAVIVDSHIMGVFRITGEAIFRWHYGRDAYVVLTIGGFFPGFNPAPAQLPADIQRVGLSLDLPVSLPIYLRVEGYVAVTANSFQFGGLLEAGIDAGAFGAHGHIKVDALFQFSPFYFESNISAGFRIEILGKTLHGVRMTGHISGPGPIVIRAEIVYETPFFLPDISWRDTFTIGRAEPRIETKIGPLFDILGPEIRNPQNLRAENPTDPAVALNKQTTAAKPRLSPLGRLVWSQRRLPLGMRLERVDNIPLEEPESVTVEPDAGWSQGEKPKERFNLAQFHELNQSQKMNLSGCVEDRPAGVQLSQDMAFAGEKKHPPTFDDYYKPDRGEKLNGLFLSLSYLTLAMVGARTSPATVANLEPRITVSGEKWQAGGQTFDGQMVAQAEARGIGAMAFLTEDRIDVGGI